MGAILVLLLSFLVAAAVTVGAYFGFMAIIAAVFGAAAAGGAGLTAAKVTSLILCVPTFTTSFSLAGFVLGCIGISRASKSNL